MKNKVYSFSTKKEEDTKLVDQMKIESLRSGRSFSWVVLQALKQYNASKTKPAA